MQEPRTWREFLATIIHDTKEKHRIASEMGVDPITLTRWANRKSSPRPRSLLNRLVNVLPSHHEQLSKLIREEFPNALGEDDPAVFFIDPIIKDVPSVLYARILEANATVVDTIRTWTISNLVMQQLVGQLDPEQVGIAAIIVQCIPPSGYERSELVRSLPPRPETETAAQPARKESAPNRAGSSSPSHQRQATPGYAAASDEMQGNEAGASSSAQPARKESAPNRAGNEAGASSSAQPARKEKVRSLREQFQQKSPALQDTASRTYFLGGESLVGDAIMYCRPIIIQDIKRDADILFIHQMEEMNSAAAYPLQKAGRVAGGLLILSTQKHFFSPARQALILSYTHLLSLAFRDSEFYALEDIELQLMPSVAVQDTYLSIFNQQVNDLLSRAERSGHPLRRPQAEQMVIEAIVEALRK